ncbi:DUF4041 domain-containing protein [Couchioplanes caeruleus]|uniref:DUF4041 domain-containing protein n=1 Tax=Couchioplanes caeruleus TaxID=56438 RepID=UPI0020BDB9CC|nr:DUF4041 domain-containing protein [Couchioplanes caeruleus]UQU62796.1 DUF4041 domain-containing protein [Couchioplanes caeruleus]
MSAAFDLWGQRGWASLDVVGESHYTNAIKALVGSRLTSDGAEITATVQLIPEPLNKHDRHAVGVWSGPHQLGYLPRQEAARYSSVLLALVARGWTPQVSSRIWAAQWSAGSQDRDGFRASVRLDLAEPHMLVPANQPPIEPHRMMPAGTAIQVTGEHAHLNALLPWLRPEGECWVYATLHEITEELLRSSRSLVEVRIDGARIGQLTPRMSGDMLPAIRHLGESDLVTGARAVVKGNRIKAEVVLYAARAHDLADSWLGRAADAAVPVQRPAAVIAPPAPVPVAPSPAPPAPSPAPVLPSTVPLIPGRAQLEPAPAPTRPSSVPAMPTPAGRNQSSGFRFQAPPNWPAPPPGWTPPPGWVPDPAWGPVPPGWQLWIPGTGTASAVAAAPPPVLEPPLPTPTAHTSPPPDATGAGIPLFGARGKARELAAEATQLRAELEDLRARMERLGVFRIEELEDYRRRLEQEIAELTAKSRAEQAELQRRLDELRQQVVVTEEKALLQEVGVYEYQHPLSDAVAYQDALAGLQERIKAMAKAEGGAVRSAAGWTVNGSDAQGRAMLRDYSKLMLRAYNAEADNLVRTLKPYKLPAAIDRLGKVAATIARLGKTMDIRITEEYHRLRVQELGLTSDYQEKLAEEKERDREEKARLREERRLQQEIERERARLDKERQHYANAVAALQATGDTDGLAQLQERLAQIDTAIQDVDYRAANVRAGYVYVISNLGAFGEGMIKVGMTRRLDPMDRVRELGDASVPFTFDVHALFFSDDAVGIEAAMHSRLADRRVNMVNHRREFFYATPAEAKQHLKDLAGNLLQYEETPVALEYRQSRSQAQRLAAQGSEPASAGSNA